MAWLVDLYYRAVWRVGLEMRCRGDVWMHEAAEGARRNHNRLVS